MGFKLLGAVFVIFSTGCIGFQCAQKLQDRVKDLYMIKKILAMLMGEIQYANSTFEEAFASIAARVEEPWKGFMSGMSERLGELSGQPFAQIWKEQVDKQLKRTALAVADRQELCALGEHLGYLDAAMQLGTIKLYLEQLEIKLAQLNEENGKKKKLYQYLGVMGGILITIVML